MAMNIVKPPQGAYWGRFNDRQIDKSWVNKLLEAFNDNLDNFADRTAIEVVVKKEWLKNASEVVESVDGKSIGTVAMIKFTDEGQQAIAKDNLWVLGGNHRRRALVEYVTTKTKELDVMKKQIRDMEAAAKPGPQGGEEDGQNLDALKRAAKRQEELIDASSLWAIRLYDRGA